MMTSLISLIPLVARTALAGGFAPRRWRLTLSHAKASQAISSSHVTANRRGRPRFITLKQGQRLRPPSRLSIVNADDSQIVRHLATINCTRSRTALLDERSEHDAVRAILLITAQEIVDVNVA